MRHSELITHYCLKFGCMLLFSLACLLVLKQELVINHENNKVDHYFCIYFYVLTVALSWISTLSSNAIQ